MDLLILADPTGAVDMTFEAISRRTNVPLDEVQRYISELCRPDKSSRSQIEDGKRLLPLDSNREWGWQIVNYMHYRRLRDQETMRSYFRDAQRKVRAKRKEAKEKVHKEEVEEGSQTMSNMSNSVKTMSLTKINTRRGLLDSEWIATLRQDVTYAGIDVDRELGKCVQWFKTKNITVSRQRFLNWLNRADRQIDKSMSKDVFDNEWKRMTWPKDWQEAKRQVRYLQKFPEAKSRIEAITAQFKL